jgi:hypothetical protein
VVKNVKAELLFLVAEKLPLDFGLAKANLEQLYIEHKKDLNFFGEEIITRYNTAQYRYFCTIQATQKTR